jgi:serine/threonine-protein kinase RsbW
LEEGAAPACADSRAVEHGNKYDPQKSVDIRFTIGVDALRVTVRDHGEGFDISTLPDPLDPNNLLNPAGRGILYMRTFMDQVEYQRHPEGGMIVTMSKRRASNSAALETGEGDHKHDAVRN